MMRDSADAGLEAGKSGPSKADLLRGIQERQQQSLDSRRKRNVNWFLLTPLLFAPILPLIRITLRHRPRVRDILFKGTLGAAFTHSALLASGVYNFTPEEASSKPSSASRTRSDSVSSH